MHIYVYVYIHLYICTLMCHKMRGGFKSEPFANWNPIKLYCRFQNKTTPNNFYAILAPPHCFSTNPQYTYHRHVRMRTAPPPPLPPPSPLNYPPHCRCICPSRPPQPLCGLSLAYAYIYMYMYVNIFCIHMFRFILKFHCLLESGPCQKMNKHSEVVTLSCSRQTGRPSEGQDAAEETRPL